MGRFNKYEMKGQMRDRPWDIHPVWRGIGCVMLILIPMMSYAGAILLVEANLDKGWYPISKDLGKTIPVPFFGNVEHFYANLLLAAILAVIGFGLLMVLYSTLYKVVGPPQYGPLDAPPVRTSPRQVRKQQRLNR